MEKKPELPNDIQSRIELIIQHGGGFDALADSCDGPGELSDALIAARHGYPDVIHDILCRFYAQGDLNPTEEEPLRIGGTLLDLSECSAAEYFAHWLTQEGLFVPHEKAILQNLYEILTQNPSRDSFQIACDLLKPHKDSFNIKTIQEVALKALFDYGTTRKSLDIVYLKGLYLSFNLPVRRVRIEIKRIIQQKIETHINFENYLISDNPKDIYFTQGTPSDFIDLLDTLINDFHPDIRNQDFFQNGLLQTVLQGLYIQASLKNDTGVLRQKIFRYLSKSYWHKACKYIHQESPQSEFLED